MESLMAVVYAEKKPIAGINHPGSHQVYRNSYLSLESRQVLSPTEHEIQVKMIYTGLCGTDLHLLECQKDTGYIRCSAPVDIPNDGRIIGHEGIGQVIAVGRHISHIQLGAYVTFESIIICHYCDMCKRGFFNQCRNAKLLGLEKDGLFGSIVNVPAMLAHDITHLVNGERISKHLLALSRLV